MSTSSFHSGSARRSTHFAWAMFLALTLGLLVFLAPAQAGSVMLLRTGPVSTEGAVSTNPTGTSIEIEEFSPALITPGDEIILRVAVTNRTSEVITNPTVSFNVMRYRFSTRGALDRWQRQELNANAGSPIAANDLGETLAPGKTATAQFTVDSNQLQLLSGTQGWGPRGVTVLFTGTDENEMVQRVDALFTYLLWDSAPPDSEPQLSLSTVVPLTGPAINPLEPQILAETIGQATAPESRLANVVAALTSIPNLSIAADPQLLERAHLTSTTPLPNEEETTAEDETAPSQEFEPTIEQRATQKWFAAASQLLLDHESYLLPDYDADLGALAVAGLPLPDPAPREVGTIPESQWRTDLLWPEPDTLSREFLTHPETANSLIVAESAAATPLQTLTYTPGALVPNVATTNSNAVIGDEVLTALMTDSQQENPIAARQRFISELAVIAKERPSEQRNIVLALPRDWDPNPAVAQAQLGSIKDLPWLSTPTLSAMAALAAPSIQDYEFEHTLASGLLDANTFHEVAAAGKELTNFAAVVPNPDLITKPISQSIDAITAVAWRTSPKARTQVAAQITASATEYLEALSVDTGNDINLISTGSEIPLTVRNALDQDATVLIQLRPDNPRLQADQAIPVTVPALGSQQVRIPVSAVGSGNVTVEVRILTTDEVLATQSGSFTVRVRADWENLGTAVVIGLLVIILGAGIIRTVRRGKSKHRTDPKDASESLEAVQQTAEPQATAGEQENH